MEMASKQEQTDEEIIFQIPDLVWRKIGEMLPYPQNDLYNTCLSSPLLDTFVEMTSLRNCKFGVIGKRVFSILVASFYLDREDLLNCTKTNCNDLGMFAACSWQFLENSQLQEVRLNNAASISRLYSEVENEKRNGKTWTVFVGKRFHLNFQKYIDSPSLDIASISQMFKSYGKYFVNIKLSKKYSVDHEDETTIKIFLLLLHGNLPNLQTMFVNYSGSCSYALAEEFQSSRTLETVFGFRTFLCLAGEEKTRICEIVSQFAQAWTMNYLDGGIGFEKLTKWNLGSLLYFPKEWGNWSQQLLFGQRVNPAQIRSLILPSITFPTESLYFAANFPNLSEVTINMSPFTEDRRYFRIPKNYLVITQVRTLTFVWNNRCPLLHLSDLLSIFPRLTFFRLESFFNKSELVRLIEQRLGQDNINVNTSTSSSSMSDDEIDVDIYHLICNGQYLAASNVWYCFPRLNVLSVRTLECHQADSGTNQNFVAIEKYRRIANGNVKLEKYYQAEMPIFRPIYYYAQKSSL